MRKFVGSHAPFAVVLVLAGALRLVELDRIPNPAGDEGTWIWLAFRLAHGAPAGLDADASFVSLTHARLMALSMHTFGDTIFAARLVGAIAALSAVAFLYAAYAWAGARRQGLVAAAVLALHPWTVLWARTASVPYALALLVLTVAPTLFVFGLRHRRPSLSAAGIVVFALGPDFSPLTFLPALACMLFAFRAEYRWVLRRPVVWVAVAIAAAHAGPIVVAAARVAHHTAPRTQLDHLASRLGSYVHLTFTGLAGEATLRHFTTAALPAWPATLLVVPVLAVLVAAMRPSVRAQSPTGGFAPFALVVTLVGMPWLLAPGRPWHLARIDTDRYLFALLPSFAMCCADLAGSTARRAHRAILAIALGVISASTARGFAWFTRGGGPDQGLEVFRGGGAYRGWHVAREHAPLAVLLRDTVLREVGRGGATIVIADMAFHPLHVVDAMAGLPVFDARLGAIPARADGRYFFVLWSDAMFPDGAWPATARDENRAARVLMHATFTNVRRVRTFVQPGGQPLCELWRGDRP